MKKIFAGMLQVELTSADLETVLFKINKAGIGLGQLELTEPLSCRFLVKRGNLKQLTTICEKSEGSLKVLQSVGFFWLGKQLIFRPVLITGLLTLLLLALFLPTRILFVRVKGNDTIPTQKIVMAAESCGIKIGASRRAVRSEKMKNSLLAVLPELKWAGVNTYGCVAEISVREGDEKKKKEKESMVSSIVAAVDGYVLSGTVTQGNGLFQPGQAVKEGQVLVSGYTDCGHSIRASRAEGEIEAQTIRNVEAVFPFYYGKEKASQMSKRKYSLLLGKKRINLWKDSGILQTSCDRMYEEYYAALPGGFLLPIALCVEIYSPYDTIEIETTQEIAESVLQPFASRYVEQQMVAGQILIRQELISQSEKGYHLKGQYTCKEMIGRERREQIGEANGKSD